MSPGPNLGPDQLTGNPSTYTLTLPWSHDPVLPWRGSWASWGWEVDRQTSMENRRSSRTLGVGEQQRWGGLRPGGGGRITSGMRKSFLAVGAAGAKAQREGCRPQREEGKIQVEDNRKLLGSLALRLQWGYPWTIFSLGLIFINCFNELPLANRLEGQDWELRD